MPTNIVKPNKIGMLKEYYEMLTQKARTKDAERFANADRAHNVVVMRVMLENAKSIKMYCGELSIFRKEFADKVNDSIEWDDELVNDFDLMKGLYSALALFLEKGNTFEAIIENPSDLEKEDIYKYILKKYIDKGQVYLYTFQNNYEKTPNAFHFLLGNDHMYRRENNHYERSAICCFNSETGTEILSWQYDAYKQHIIPISLAAAPLHTPTPPPPPRH